MNISETDRKRLAALIARLADGGPEAEIAGRKVAEMAKRLGISGGDLHALVSGQPSPPRDEPAPQRETQDPSYNFYHGTRYWTDTVEMKQGYGVVFDSWLPRFGKINLSNNFLGSTMNPTIPFVEPRYLIALSCITKVSAEPLIPGFIEILSVTRNLNFGFQACTKYLVLQADDWAAAIEGAKAWPAASRTWRDSPNMGFA